MAAQLGRDAKDPRLASVTITGTRVTPDWREAIVFYTVLGDDADRAAAEAALASATGVLRSSVGRALGIRHTPSLTFEPDPVPDQIQLIDGLMAQAREADAEVARAAQGASYAGDPDPYRHDDETDDESDGESTRRLDEGKAVGEDSSS